MARLDDSRIYRVLYVGSDEYKADNNAGKNTSQILVKPYNSRYSYAGDFLETPEAVKINAISILESDITQESADKLLTDSNDRIKQITILRNHLSGMYTATMSMIHPYALVRLTGTNERGDRFKPGDQATMNESGNSNLFDSAERLRWYEIDAKFSTVETDSSGNTVTKDYFSPIGDELTNDGKGYNYAKSPTTKDLINWSTYDRMGRFPYSFQDFVFCKYWNRIENNRLITLRRYPAPVLDNVMPANYKEKNPTQLDDKGDNRTQVGSRITQSAFAPVATAVTYFGEGTDNSIKDLLKFTVGYNWSEITSDVHNTTSNQIEEGQVFNGANTTLNSGLGMLAIMTGLMGDYSGKNSITPPQIRGNPPDPYQNGPYENRVIGPVNVIMNVHKRERGLKFEQDSIVLTFDYVSRPISHVNNKAILLDLLANILAMSYSSGTWFGGAYRYRVEHPSVYPWRDMNSLNKIYQGKLFGKDGAFMSIFNNFFNSETKDFVTNFAKDIIEGVKAYAKDIVNAIKGGGGQSEADVQANYKKKIVFDKIANTAGRAIAAHLLRGQQVPWLENAKALLTGEPIGDWHITLGNPMNPIAMIGNLIVDNCEIEFSDELGPDDFPIGFKARITLKHGMGRDKDAVESMFNRGNGRIYMLSDAFKSSADQETTVDDHTGKHNNLINQIKVENWGALKTTGSFEITNYKAGNLELSADRISEKRFYNPTIVRSMVQKDINGVSTPYSVVNLFKTTPWAMHYIL